MAQRLTGFNRLTQIIHIIILIVGANLRLPSIFLEGVSPMKIIEENKSPFQLQVFLSVLFFLTMGFEPLEEISLPHLPEVRICGNQFNQCHLPAFHFFLLLIPLNLNLCIKNFLVF
jgi:hypothetical protein